MDKVKEDMMLSEFINKTIAIKGDTEWNVKIPLFDGTIGNLYVTGANSEYEAKERAYIYLKEYFINKTQINENKIE